MKKVKYPNLDNYDLSAYEELKGDIDYAKAQLGISDSGSGTSVSGSVGNSGSNGNTPSSPSSPSSPTKTNDATANTVKGPDHHSAYDQQYINEMMENARKNALSGNVIQGTAVSGKRFEGTEIEGKGAWEVKNEWTDAYIKKYREYTPKKIEEYRSKNMRFTCEDLGLSVLIDFASENNLPVTITNGSGKYSSLGIRQGGKIDSMFYSATYGSSSYAGLEINGKAYDFNHDIYYGYKNGARYEFVNAFIEYGMSFRSWDFDRM